MSVWDFVAKLERDHQQRVHSERAATLRFAAEMLAHELHIQADESERMVLSLWRRARARARTGRSVVAQ